MLTHRTGLLWLNLKHNGTSESGVGLFIRGGGGGGLALVDIDGSSNISLINVSPMFTELTLQDYSKTTFSAHMYSYACQWIYISMKQYGVNITIYLIKGKNSKSLL